MKLFSEKDTKLIKAIKVIALNILIANIALVVFARQAFFDVDQYIHPFLYSFAMSISFWYSFYISRKFLDKQLPFNKYFIVRYITDLFVMLSIAIANSFIITWFFFSFIWKIEPTGAENWDTLKYTILSFLVTFPFIYSIVFMSKWKKSITETEKLKQKHLELEYESLKTQMNPHFLFNSLNSLTALIEHDSAKAVKFVKTLSDIYRYILDSKNAFSVAVSDELKFALQYVSLQQIRFGDNLKIENSLPEDISGNILPLSIQIMIENALKHNIVSNSRPLTIYIEYANRNIIIRNNLQPKQQDTKGRGIGLYNISELYKQCYNMDMIVNKTEEFFEIQLPVIENSNR